MEDFQPEILYRVKKYKKLIQPYEVGVGVEDERERIAKAAIAHHDFLAVW
jgi:hypothetical protein